MEQTRFSRPVTTYQDIKTGKQVDRVVPETTKIRYVKMLKLHILDILCANIVKKSDILKIDGFCYFQAFRKTFLGVFMAAFELIDSSEQTARPPLSTEAAHYMACAVVLFRELGVDELAVETGDVAQRYVLGALGGAGTGVGAVAETEFVHLAHHGACTAFALYLSLWQ